MHGWRQVQTDKTLKDGCGLNDCKWKQQEEVRVKTMVFLNAGYKPEEQKVTYKEVTVFRDERGVTTVTMVVSLLVSIALIFSGAQLYRVHSACADVQEVADVCVLAAENEVAGFQTVADTCDAACLSMTLLAISLYGLGLVAACVPSTESISAKLLEMAHETVEKRSSFYGRACAGLNAAQRALPFIAACNASHVAQANKGGVFSADYVAAAVLVPADFTELGQAVDDGLSDVSSRIDQEAESIQEQAREAEEAAEEANEAKERGFQEDCGADPAYCMRERAASLAGLSDALNPAYASVDTWSFNVALDRARAYYQKRIAIWRMEGSTVEAQADSVIRKRFYEYAVKQLENAFVHDGPEGFSAYIPHLFRNTAELRQTALYTECVYPVTVQADKRTMHAWNGCPHAGGAAYLGSVSELEASRDSFTTCPLCKFVPSSVGGVAAASTSIQNGFENHYEAMRQACEAYAGARAKADPLVAAVKAKVQPLLDALLQTLGNAAAFRIHAEPPGRSGALALIANTAESTADAGFSSSFVRGDAVVGTRAAVSAATLVTDGTESPGAVVTESLESLLPTKNGLGAGASIAANAWMNLLRTYTHGQAALEGAIENGLASFSQTSASGLGKWAAAALDSIIKAAGLEPASTKCRKPCILNTSHVAQADDSSICVNFVQAKEAALRSSSPSTSTLSALFAGARNTFSDSATENSESDAFAIAQIQLPFGIERVIQWAIPQPENTAGLMDQIIEVLDSVGFVGMQRVWQ